MRNRVLFGGLATAVLLIVGAVFSPSATAEDSKEAAIRKLRARLAPALKLELWELKLALELKVKEVYTGAQIVTRDPTTEEVKVLGVIDSPLKQDSIFNEHGPHGSEHSSDSIWNEFGEYGSEHQSDSWKNPYATNPPALVKNGKVIGHLTVKETADAVDPRWLRTYFK